MTREEFDEEVGRHYEDLLKVARAEVHKRVRRIEQFDAEATAGDIVNGMIQEMIDPLKGETYKTFRGDSTVKTWLIGAVRKHLERWTEKRGKRRKNEVPIQEPREETDGEETLAPYDAGSEPERRRLEDEMISAVDARTALDALPDDIGDVFRRLVNGATWEEAAAELRVNKRTLQKLVAPWREQLRRALTHEDEDHG